MSNRFTLHLGDCLEVLRGMPDNSVDSIVTDPPYGLGKEPDALAMLRDWMEKGHHDHKSKSGFMGKKWDSFVPQPAVWAECLRVLKPGGYLLAFAGTRTQDLVALGLRIAGFEIRDLIAWVYGSGFPKSRNGEWGGTALKPALEPITMARKPLVGTVAANWALHGTGALNIDGCRVGTEVITQHGRGDSANVAMSGRNYAEEAGREWTGRWPANLIHDGSDEVLQAFPLAPGQKADLSATAPSAKLSTVYAGGPMPRVGEASQDTRYTESGGTSFSMLPGARRLDTGSAARFFYCPKASRADRNSGMASSSTPAVQTDATMRDCQTADWSARNGNNHPTVKPTDLMAYLLRLVTPPGGVALDPYAGSGSTGKAAMREGFQFIGIDNDMDSIAIATARIQYEAYLVEESSRAAAVPVPQLDLFETV